MANPKGLRRYLRHRRIRKSVQGTSDRPRICIHRSLNHLQAQMIDDITGKVLFGISTLDKNLRSTLKSGGNIQAATALGERLAEVAKKKGITKVCFDRGGYLYHGRVKAFAEAARQAGLEF